jgi:hypothetical protein
MQVITSQLAWYILPLCGEYSGTQTASFGKAVEGHRNEKNQISISPMREKFYGENPFYAGGS